MRASFFRLVAVCISMFSLAACSRETPTKPEPSPVKPVESSTISAVTASSPAPIASVTNTSAPAPIASASSSALAPKPIAGADVPRAKEYVQNLARGRKATVSKDYAHAVAFFDKALVAEPGDARALAERGYAYLLSDNVDAASKDLEAAAKRAANVDLLRQILFNQATVAEKRGDTKTAESLRARRDELGQAKRSKSKDCSLSITRPGTLPVKVSSAKDAWVEIKKAHFQHWNVSPMAMDEPAIADNASEETIRKVLFGAIVGDGSIGIMTASAELEVMHLVMIRGKDIYIHGGIGGFQRSRCPHGDGLPRIVDGAFPRVVMESEFLELGYMCENAQGTAILPCDEMPDGNPVQSYCYRFESKFRTWILDPKTFAMILDIEETAETKGRTTFDSGQSRAAITVQPDAVLITGCGVDQREKVP